MVNVDVPSAHEERLLTFETLGTRWGVHPKTACRRARALGLPVIRWNQRAICVRLSDVLKAEEAATV